MKTRLRTWMIAFALAGVCAGQQADEIRRFNEQYDRRVEQATAAYPDFMKPESPLYKRIAELDNALKLSGDPLFNSADKPMIIAQRAAKELGIEPVSAPPVPAASVARELNSKTIPEMWGYKSVVVRKVEPDGLRIMHESGTTKIRIEKLTDDQRTEYGLTMDGAVQYRKQVAENAATRYARQQEAARTRQETSRPAAEEKNPLGQWIGPGHQMAMDSYLAKFGPRFRVSGTFKEGPMKGKTLKQAIAKFEQIWATSPASVRLNWAKRAMMAGQTPEIQAAAAAEAEARRIAQSQVPAPQPMRRLAPPTFTRDGNQITIDGDAGSGYRIQGDKLFESSTGKATHVRSGGTWIPLDSSHPQLRDP